MAKTDRLQGKEEAQVHKAWMAEMPAAIISSRTSLVDAPDRCDCRCAAAEGTGVCPGVAGAGEPDDHCRGDVNISWAVRAQGYAHPNRKAELFVNKGRGLSSNSHL